MERIYSFLGPAGTFTEQALKQVEGAQGQPWRAAANVGEALEHVQLGESYAAMIAIENSVEGGVSVTQDALARTEGLQIIGEYVVPVDFVLVQPEGAGDPVGSGRAPGTPAPAIAASPTASVSATAAGSADHAPAIAAHPVAYAQCRETLDQLAPNHTHVQATSNVQAVLDMIANPQIISAAIAPATILDHHRVAVVARNLCKNRNTVTRFVLVSRRQQPPAPTGRDKTSLIVDLPENRAGSLLALLEQFASRSVNLTLISSRPIGDRLGRYRFVIDAEGHILDRRVREAVIGLKRISPRVLFLGSYPRADGLAAEVDPTASDEAFDAANTWLDNLISGFCTES